MTLIKTPDEITGAWLAAALGRDDLHVDGTERIGTGQMSQNHRVTFRADGGPQETVVVKLASDDPMSRGTGVGMGAYFREIAFYANLAPRIGDPLPRCLLAEYDPAEGWFTLVLEEVVGATQGDQVAGCTPAEARLAMATLARVHAPVLGDLHVGMADYLNQPNPLTQALLEQLLPGYLERYKDRLAPEHVEVCQAFVPVADAWAAERPLPHGLVHGDYRLDNLLFSREGGGSCKVVDWQTVSWGPCMVDAAYFVGGALSIEDRRAHEEELVRVYHDALREYGIQDFAWEDCWRQYRRATFHQLVMNIAAPMVVQQTPRGDDMFMAVMARNAQQILDLDALSLLPARDAAPPAPLTPDPADEGRHPPGPEAMWNESWYFDAVADDESLGVYVRLGRLPNQDVALYTACVCGPDRPSIMLVDAAAPLPDAGDDAQVVDADGLHAEQHCEEPLKRWRLVVRGTAEAHLDESAPLRSSPGDPVEIALELVWETVGTPYQWRQATRYEIPCRVTGSVRVGDEEIAFAGPGQRDHSWGARDWWAMDWMWSALHLDDGTHVHAVGLPERPGVGVGYVQKDGEVTEIKTVTATAQVAEDDLVDSARIETDDLALDVEPVAFGAIRLEAPDGRLSLFPRAMCKVHADDGRTGTGWVEWNRVQR